MELSDMHVAKLNAVATTAKMTSEQLRREELERLIPLIVYLSLISICGTLGNCLVCHVYKTKYGPSNCRLFVICLSAIDLFSCVLVIPFEIAVVSKEYNFTVEVACQISVFLNTWPTLSSGLMLLAIAVDRYRKVCKPFGWQISLRWARYICIINIFLAVGFSWPSPILYGTNRKIISPHNITISECAIKSSMKMTIYPLINNIMFGVLFLGSLVSISFMYCFIGIGVKRHSKKRMYQIKARGRESVTLADATNASELTIRSGHVTMDSKKPADESIENSDAMFASDTSETKTEEFLQQEPCIPREHQIDKPPPERKSFISLFEKSVKNRNTLFLTKSVNPQALSHLPKRPSTRSHSSRLTPDSRRNGRQLKTHKTAYIMFLISMAFIMSYLPLLVILLTRSINTQFVAGLSEPGRAAYKFFLRSYYLNCMLNPIIYGVWDARFRKACKKLLQKLKI